MRMVFDAIVAAGDISPSLVVNRMIGRYSYSPLGLMCLGFSYCLNF